MGDLDEIDDDDLDWNNCIAIPHRNDLDMGQELVFEFVKNHSSSTRSIPNEGGAISLYGPPQQTSNGQHPVRCIQLVTAIRSLNPLRQR